MDFDNTTPLLARMFRGEPQPRLMLATVVVKVVYEVGPDGTLSRQAAEEAVIREQDEDSPLGLLPGDQVPYRSGVNVYVHGQAYAPGGSARAMEVALALDGLEHRVLVVGDRYWTRDGHIGVPAPFSTMPLVYARAYGGLAESRGSQVAFPGNPHGRGFVYEAEHLEGTALPNLEDPEHRIERWQDRPRPRCWAPLPPQTGLHLERAVEILDPEQGQYRLTPRAFDCAHPDLVRPELSPGSRGVLTGVTPAGPFVFEVPPSPVQLEVELGPKRFELNPALDTLGVLVEARRIEATFRASFRYHLVPKQLRRTCLRLASRTETP